MLLCRAVETLEEFSGVACSGECGRRKVEEGGRKEKRFPIRSHRIVPQVRWRVTSQVRSSNRKDVVPVLRKADLVCVYLGACNPGRPSTADCALRRWKDKETNGFFQRVMSDAGGRVDFSRCRRRSRFFRAMREDEVRMEVKISVKSVVVGGCLQGFRPKFQKCSVTQASGGESPDWLLAVVGWRG